jgi:hypothetical protein
METKVAHSLSLDKIRSVVSSALVKFYGSGDPVRLKIYQGGNRLNFCCPYCGDSPDPTKKRGNLYTDTLSYKCYNGGCEVFRSLNSFIRDFSLGEMVDSDEMTEIINFSRQRIANKKIRNSIDFFFAQNYKDILIERDFLKKKVGLIEVQGTYAEKWLKERNQYIDSRYLYDPRRRSLYLLNLTGNGSQVIGLQLRPIVKKNSHSKYFTYKLSVIYKKLLNELDPDKILRAEELDPISTVFGFSYVDMASMITVFEGPMDAWLCPNSIALCSINNQFPFDVDNKRWFLDGDKTGRDKASELLENGEIVFLWGKFLKENNLPDRDKWDLNDVVNYVRSTGNKIKNLENYFSSDVLDIIDV